jgi:hypothetical protein
VDTAASELSAEIVTASDDATASNDTAQTEPIKTEASLAPEGEPSAPDESVLSRGPPQSLPAEVAAVDEHIESSTSSKQRDAEVQPNHTQCTLDVVPPSSEAVANANSSENVAPNIEDAPTLANDAIHLETAASDAEEHATLLESQAMDASARAAIEEARQAGIIALRELLNRPRVTHITPAVGWGCTFMTDVEGHWEFFNKQVTESSVLSWDSDGSLTLVDNGYFVHGGDAVDKGPGDIRVLRAMVELKEKYPDRVILILGNRDVNKLRIVSELHPDHLGKNPVFWDARHTT